MDNLGGRLLPLWDEDMVLGALQDMERAGRMALKLRDVENDVECEKSMSDGKAVLGTHNQLTPGDSPPLVAEKLEELHLGEVPSFRLNDGIELQLLPLF